MDILTTKSAIRTEFYNAIAQLITYDEVDTLPIQPNDVEKEAIHKLLDKLGRYYYAPPCTKVVSTFYQDQLARLVNPSLPDEGDHEACPCVRSEKHNDFHRCKHGYYSK